MGKAVLLLDGAPAGFKPAAQGWRNASSVYGKIAAARSKGAAAVIIAAKGFPRRVGASGGQQYTDLFKSEHYPNTFTVSDSVARAIAGGDSCWNAWVNAGKTGKVTGTVIKANVKLAYSKKTEELSSSNVLAYIEGSDKSNEWLVISAHYDHLGKRGDVIYYGADDDGSGTVGVLEIAEAFVKAKAEGKGPRRNILFLAVSGEEKGLWGSEYFSEHPTIPMDKTTADLNIDMIGRTDTERLMADTLNYVYVVGDDKLSSELKPISEGVNTKYTKLVLDYKFNDPKDPNRIYYRSDHFNFAAKGVPIIFYYDGMLKADYHKPSDTPDKINYPLLAKRAQLVFHTAWEMANRENLLKRDIPLN
jgi:Zn-dependent M28 family amino/carboxypeptidase